MNSKTTKSFKISSAKINFNNKGMEWINLPTKDKVEAESSGKGKWMSINSRGEADQGESPTILDSVQDVACEGQVSFE